jgi:DNA-binding transcriptional MerR regulator
MNNNDKFLHTMSIGKVAQIVGVKEHTIRFWQKHFPHIKCSIGKGNRRYYSIDAVEQFKEIKYLMYDRGLKISGILQLVKWGKVKINMLPQSLKTENDEPIDMFAPPVTEHFAEFHYAAIADTSTIAESVECGLVQMGLFDVSPSSATPITASCRVPHGMIFSPEETNRLVAMIDNLEAMLAR